MAADPIEIKPLTRTKHIFMGMYGPPDIGKTTLLGNRANTLILRPPTDHTDSIFDPPPGVREWVMSDHADLANAIDYLHYSGKKWDWVWFDSATLWQDHGLDDIWQGVVDRRPDRAGGPIDKGEYNLNMVRLARFIRHCVGLDEFNFGFTALTMDGEDPLTGNMFLMPRIQGKGMPEKFTGYMNLVGYYHWATVKGADKQTKRVRMMRFQSAPEYYAKCQFKDAFPNGRMQDPTMEKIETAIAAARKRVTTPAAIAAKPAASSARAKAAAAAAAARKGASARR